MLRTSITRLTWCTRRSSRNASHVRVECPMVNTMGTSAAAIQIKFSGPPRSRVKRSHAVANLRPLHLPDFGCVHIKITGRSSFSDGDVNTAKPGAIHTNERLEISACVYNRDIFQYF